MIQLDESKDKTTVESWYHDANQCRTLGGLLRFANLLLGQHRQYEHDYGTVCHAVAAVAVAAAWVANRMPGACGGITGFQSGAVMWQFIAKWGSFDGPARLVDYRDMLYPQYDEKFQKTITPETWKWLKRRAAELLKEDDGHPNVRQHWETMVAGNVPFGYVVKD